MPASPRAMSGALRRSAMGDQGALYDFVFNVKEFLNSLGANLSLEPSAAPAMARTYAVGSALTLTEAVHAGRLGLLDTAAGSTVTLPAASGSGAVYRFAVSVLATSNSHKIQVANATDVLRGVMLNTDSDTSDAFTGFNTTSTSDTITLNRSTTGSVYIGEFIEIIDIKAGFYAVRGWFAATGSPATPFSAAVS